MTYCVLLRLAIIHLARKQTAPKGFRLRLHCSLTLRRGRIQGIALLLQLSAKGAQVEVVDEVFGALIVARAGAVERGHQRLKLAAGLESIADIHATARRLSGPEIKPTIVRAYFSKGFTFKK